jgi:hypothetical protein
VATREALDGLPHELLYNLLDVALESDDRQLLEKCLVAWVCRLHLA